MPHYPEKRRSYPDRLILVIVVLFAPVLLCAQPVITSFSPGSGPIGTSVTITGSNFAPASSSNIVFFGGVRATVQSASANSLSVTVPSGAGYQPISVTVNSLTGYSTRPFVTSYSGVQPIVENINTRQTTFAAEVDSVTDLHPNVIAAADLDGDGRLDIVTANNYSTTGQPASVSVLRNTGKPGVVSFSAANNIPTGVETYAVALGDLDGDGKPDMVSSSVVDQAISVFRNTSSSGAISFASPLSFPTGRDPFRIAIADLDGDGRPDLLVTSYLSGFVSIYRNTTTGGSLSFAARVDLTTGLGPCVVAAGDLDGDGMPDMAVSNQLSNTVAVFRNVSSAGNISFSAAQSLAASGSPYGVAIGDLDGDGKAELVVANNAHPNYSIFRNTSTGGAISFAAKTDVNCGASPYEVAIGDVNGDGLPEVVVGSINLSVSQNNCTPGTIAMSGPYYLFPRYTAFMPLLADLDGDGKNDLVASFFSDDKIGLFRNRNNEPKINSFTPADAIAGQTVTISGYDFSGAVGVSFGGVPAASFTIADANTITAVVGNGASGEVSVTNQYGTGSWTGFAFHAPPVINSFSPMNAGTGDTLLIKGKYLTGVSAVLLGGVAAVSFEVSSDSTMTAVVGSGATGDISLTTPYGSGALSGFVYFPQPVITSFTPAGGGIGTTIQVTGNFLSGASSVTIGGVPAASFVVNSPTSLSATTGEGAEGAIVITTPGGTVVSAASFAFPTPVITAVSPAMAAIGSQVTITGGNFRSDPSADAVFFGAVRATVVAASTTSLRVIVPAGATLAPVSVTANNHTAFAAANFLATYPPGATKLTDSSFAQRGDFTTPYSAAVARIVDFDGDGKPDILTTNTNDGYNSVLSVLQNKSTPGRPSFVYQLNLQTATASYAAMTVETGDLNGDGKPDIVAAGNNGMISIFENISANGVIAFAAPVEYPAVYIAYHITLGDFDGDTKTDIALSSLGGDLNTAYVSFFRNTGRNGAIEFAPRFDMSVPDYPFTLRSADLDGDGRPDLAGKGNQNYIVMRNTSVPGTISFAAPQSFAGNLTQQFDVADMDGDGRPDLVSAGGGQVQGVLSIFRNTSAPGTISFAAGVDLATFPGYVSDATVYAGQLDGDGKPDLIVMNEAHPIALFRNTSSPGAISLETGPILTPKLSYGFVEEGAIGDVDGDGKADMAIADGPDRTITIYRNQTGENSLSVCELAPTSIVAGVAGSAYQWQVNNGNGWAPLADDNVYGGTTTGTLAMPATPYSLDGSQYRCLVDGTPGTITDLTVGAGTRYAGSASLPAQVCADSSYSVQFVATDYIPVNTGIELWGSEGGGVFVKMATGKYVGSRLAFSVKDTTGKAKRYFCRIVPAAGGTACYVSTQTDTVSTAVLVLPPPVISLKDSIITIGNPDAAGAYTWQVQDSAGNWGIFGGASGNPIVVVNSGVYRVMESKTGCSTLSNTAKYVKPVVNNPPPAGTDSSLHVQSYPNPVTTVLVIDSLRLSDEWTTLEIIHVADGRRIRIVSIIGQTTVTVPVGDLQPGLYVAVLRRKKGGPVTIKFLKV